MTKEQFKHEIRTLNIKSIQENKVPIEFETLTKTDRYNEYVMTGLRTIWGVSFAHIESQFGLAYLEYLHKQIQPHLQYFQPENRSTFVLFLHQRTKF